MAVQKDNNLITVLSQLIRRISNEQNSISW